MPDDIFGHAPRQAVRWGVAGGSRNFGALLEDVAPNAAEPAARIAPAAGSPAAG